MAQAPGRWLGPATVLLMLTLAPNALAACQGAECIDALVAVGSTVVEFAADRVDNPFSVWTDCPGFVYCSDSDPIFGAPTECPVNEFPLSCPYTHHRDFAGDGLDYAGRFPASAAPDATDAMLLVGQGHETVTINGNTYACAGDSVAALEASRKAAGLEPSVTFGFGGASAAWPGAALACFEGERVQPGRGNLVDGSDFPEGAWTTVKEAGGHVWVLSVGAPDPSGVRAVSYAYTSPDGQQAAAFEGALLEWR